MPTISTGNATYDRALEGVSRLPPFSPVLTKLLATLSKDDVMVGQLADWIEKDTVLTGNVMRMVNSAAYGRAGRVSSVRHAITILGTTRLRNVVLSLSVCNMMAQVKLPAGWSSKQFNLHAVAVANMADMVAQYMTVEFAEGAFIAGLLHDVGKLLLAVTCADEYAPLLAEARMSRRSLYEVEIGTLGFSHAELSDAVLHLWKLPTPVRTAARFHHNPDADSSAPGISSLSRAVHVADIVVNALGITATPTDEPQQDAVAILDTFGLGPKALRILQSFEQEMEALKGVL